MDRIEEELQIKYDNLKAYLLDLGSLAVAFSSGVDSTLLLKVAKEVLGNKAIAVTAHLCSFPQREFVEAKAFCEKEGIRHYICEADEFEIEGFAENPPNRCYLCKKALFGKIIGLASEQGIAHVVEGSNMDDLGDYRPGLKAIEELKVKSPLRECKFTKAEIRALSKKLGLPTWEKPSYACLSSRFVYGETITREKLLMVEKAEQILLDMGFRQIRVRIHGNLARIEVDPMDFSRIMEAEIRNEIYNKLKEYGFDYIALDMKGYRTGSMNEILEIQNE